MEKTYTLSDGTKVIFEYDHNRMGIITLECMDTLMSLLKATAEQTEPQTYITEDRDTQILDAWQVKLKAEQTEPQKDIHDLTDCDFCKDRNCKDCEGGKDEPQTEREGE